jgi:hypothetical protein
MGTGLFISTRWKLCASLAGMNLPEPIPVDHPALLLKVPMRIERFRHGGRWNTPGVYGLEILPGSQNRLVIIAAELKENTGSSITNCIESLATEVCRSFRLPPARTVWIEHYGYGMSAHARGFDLVTFRQTINPDLPLPASSAFGSRDNHDDDTPELFFHDPRWHPMNDQDWLALGLRPRPPICYD